MPLPRGSDRQRNQDRVGDEGGQPAPAEDGALEAGQVRCQGDEHPPRFPGSAQSETNSLWLGREAPPVGGIEEGPVREV